MIGIIQDVNRLMELVDKFGETCEWHGARPGDDANGQKDKARQVIEFELRLRLAQEMAPLSVIEPHLASLEMPEVAGCLKIIRDRLEKLSPTEPIHYPLDRLDGVVGFEGPDGHMHLSSWSGQTVSVFASFDCDPHSLLKGDLRKHMVAAYDSNGVKPAGAIRCICFLKQN